MLNLIGMERQFNLLLWILAELTIKEHEELCSWADFEGLKMLDSWIFWYNGDEIDWCWVIEAKVAIFLEFGASKMRTIIKGKTVRLKLPSGLEMSVIYSYLIEEWGRVIGLGLTENELLISFNFQVVDHLMPWWGYFDGKSVWFVVVFSPSSGCDPLWIYPHPPHACLLVGF